MSSSLSPNHDMAGNLSTQMNNSHLDRRNSRSSGSQAGNRSSRIEKPRSIHNSPRTVEKRRSTASTKRYATMEDHFNMMFGITGDEESQEDDRAASRPMSWHPSSTEFHVPPSSSVLVEQSPAQGWSRGYSTSSRNSIHGSDFYSLSARSSLFPDQMSNYANYTPSHDEHRGSQDSHSSWQSQQTGTYSLSSFSTPATEPMHMQWYLQDWARKNEAENSSRNVSTDFLPIQHPASNEAEEPREDCEMEDSGKELVGMGLYDLPTQSWNFSSLVEGTGKGLKLEETWQPPEEDDDEEEAEDDDDASSDDGSVEESPPATQEATKLPISDAKPHITGNMQGQSFFFEEDDSYTKEWWFHQLKNPSVPVRDTDLGHGWL